MDFLKIAAASFGDLRCYFPRDAGTGIENYQTGFHICSFRYWRLKVETAISIFLARRKELLDATIALMASGLSEINLPVNPEQVAAT
jgi:hypothetical protein